MAAGERLRSLRFGGGGWGDPLQRAPEAVLADVLDGVYSETVARSEFGVVLRLAEEGIDTLATENLRARMVCQDPSEPGDLLTTA